MIVVELKGALDISSEVNAAIELNHFEALCLSMRCDAVQGVRRK